MKQGKNPVHKFVLTALCAVFCAAGLAFSATDAAAQDSQNFTSSVSEIPRLAAEGGEPVVGLRVGLAAERGIVSQAATGRDGTVTLVVAPGQYQLLLGGGDIDPATEFVAIEIWDGTAGFLLLEFPREAVVEGTSLDLGIAGKFVLIRSKQNYDPALVN